MADKKMVLHLGGPPLSTNTLNRLSRKFSYHHLVIDNSLAKRIKVLAGSSSTSWNNSKTIFLLSREMMSHLALLQLDHLPSTQVFYESLSGATDEQVHILRLKESLPTDLSDTGQAFIEHVNNDFDGEEGFNGAILNSQNVVLPTDFWGTITQRGIGGYVLDGDFGRGFQQVLIWKNEFILSGTIDVYAEIGEVSDTVEYFLRAYFWSDNRLIYEDFVNGRGQREQLQFNLGQHVGPVTVALFAKGKGRVVIGNIHLRRHLPNKNYVYMGGHRLIADSDQGQELNYYFNAGNLKPPLNVYFSGFRPKDGYEARPTFGSFGTPFILFHDPRLQGGSFYRNNELENQVIAVIRQSLNRLGFSSQQLILSGLSMGSYAAMYFGATLMPHAILTGKPLVNLGHLAEQSRLFAPDSWDLARDTLLNLTGELTEKSARDLDQQFWARFKSGDFSKTTFIIAHMLQDADLPFDDLIHYLNDTFPGTKILHKGISGRHNDASGELIDWFFRQYRQLLKADFDVEPNN